MLIVITSGLIKKVCVSLGADSHGDLATFNPPPDLFNHFVLLLFLTFQRWWNQEWSRLSALPPPVTQRKVT